MLGHETKAELALRVLRERILTGEFPPGRKLDIKELSAEFEMSQTPIREALKVLQSDRLVHYRPHVGTVVAGLSERTLAEIFFLRAMLEPAATELAVANLTPARLAELEVLHERAIADAPQLEASVFAERNAQWHWALYNAAGSTYLADFIRRIWDAFPWRAISSVADRRDRSVAEHEAIMAAVRGGDGPAAAEAMRAHVNGSRGVMRIPDSDEGLGSAAAATLVASSPSPLRRAAEVADVG